MGYKYQRSKYKSIQKIQTKEDCIYTFTRSPIDEKLCIHIKKLRKKGLGRIRNRFTYQRLFN